MIYCVEDERNIRELLVYTLETTGFEAEGFETGVEFDAAMKKSLPELILLDIMMPNLDGIRATRKIRETCSVPNIMLSDKSEDVDKILGLNIGADDYITKPFSVLELISRVRAILRRCSVDDRQDVIKLGQIVFDDSKHIVTSCGEECNLTFKEYELLKYLLKNKGMALTRENIILNVWGYDFEGESRTVDMHITTLRQKLGSCGNLIKTVRNVGYKAGE